MCVAEIKYFETESSLTRVKIASIFVFALTGYPFYGLKKERITMKNERIRKITASEMYRMKRPEYFSDSEITYSVKLTREQLSFELDKLSSNQKQDEFETLCRRLAEKFISPN